MTRLRHDLNHLTSTGLLAAAIATGVTGLIADLWDLNDFWYHTVAGYVMGVLAIAHVVFNWRVLWGYAKFRLFGRARRPDAPSGGPVARPSLPAARAPEPAPSGGLRHALVSRRGLIGATLGAGVGLVLGRSSRQQPPIPQGSDVDVIYHEWSKPGIVDALGSVANWGASVPLYKRYPGAPMVELGKPDLEGGLSAAEAIMQRRSTRTFAPQPMTR